MFGYQKDIIISYKDQLIHDRVWSNIPLILLIKYCSTTKYKYECFICKTIVFK